MGRNGNRSTLLRKLITSALVLVSGMILSGLALVVSKRNGGRSLPRMKTGGSSRDSPTSMLSSPVLASVGLIPSASASVSGETSMGVHARAATLVLVVGAFTLASKTKVGAPMVASWG